MIYSKKHTKDEENALLEIEKTFKCECGRNGYHFPKIVRIYKGFYGMRMDLTDCGNTHKDIIGLNKQMVIPDLHEQLDCMINNLMRAKLIHLDIHKSGKNQCVQDDGLISLIDFDMVHFETDYETPLSINNCSQKVKNRYPSRIHLEKRLSNTVLSRHQEIKAYMRERYLKTLRKFVIKIKINIGHTIQTSIEAMKLLLNNGFKVDIHIMPKNWIHIMLPGSTLCGSRMLHTVLHNDHDEFEIKLKVYKQRLSFYIFTNDASSV